MLLPQISDGQKKKIATEFGFDLKILHAKRTTEYAANDERIARLETVVSFIREFGNLGTMDKTNEYIEDSAPMRSTELGAELGLSERGIAYFTGTVDNNTIGLGGSMHHLIGAGLEARAKLGSLTLSILGAIQSDLDGSTDKDDARKRVGIFGIEDVAAALKDNNCPTENLRFMAKRLVFKPKGELPKPDEQFILGTPLYVMKED